MDSPEQPQPKPTTDAALLSATPSLLLDTHAGGTTSSSTRGRTGRAPRGQQAGRVVAVPLTHGRAHARAQEHSARALPYVRTRTRTCGGFIMSALQIWPDRLGHRLMEASLRTWVGARAWVRVRGGRAGGWQVGQGGTGRGGVRGEKGPGHTWAHHARSSARIRSPHVGARRQPQALNPQTLNPKPQTPKPRNP